MTCKVHRSGVGTEGHYWTIIRAVKNNVDYHAVVYTTELKVEGMEINIPNNVRINWEVSGDFNRLRIFPPGGTARTCSRGHFKDSILNFGLYRGYELGIVYAFDLHYIEWCIINIKDFFIIDWEELMELGVFRKSTQHQENRDDFYMADYFKFIKEFKSIITLDQVTGVLNNQIGLSDDALALNENKLDKYCRNR